MAESPLTLGGMGLHSRERVSGSRGGSLSVLASVLDGEGLEWYVFGAQAVATWGAPRATQDMDVTVAIPRLTGGPKTRGQVT